MKAAVAGKVAVAGKAAAVGKVAGVARESTQQSALEKPRARKQHQKHQISGEQTNVERASHTHSHSVAVR